MLIRELNYKSEVEKEKIFKLSLKSKEDNGKKWRAQTTIAIINDPSWKRGRTRVFVAEDHGIIGFITCYKPISYEYDSIIPDQPFVIWDIYVKPEYRRQGIGKELVNKYFGIEQISQLPIVNYPVSEGLKAIIVNLSNTYLAYYDRTFTLSKLDVNNKIQLFDLVEVLEFLKFNHTDQEI